MNPNGQMNFPIMFPIPIYRSTFSMCPTPIHPSPDIEDTEEVMWWEFRTGIQFGRPTRDLE